MTAKKKTPILPHHPKPIIEPLVVEIEEDKKYMLNWIMIRRKINAFTNIFRRKKI